VPGEPAAGADGLKLEELRSLRFEQLVELLEDLTGRMASGHLGIEEATDLYEQAEAVHAMAVERLEEIRRRIEALSPSETR
jgi:exodeoxyribonuclease VII small subunit